MTDREAVSRDLDVEKAVFTVSEIARIARERDTALAERQIDKEISASHSALIGKIQAVIDKAFPDSREADYDVLAGGVARLLAEREGLRKRVGELEDALLRLEGICRYAEPTDPGLKEQWDCRIKAARLALRTEAE